MTTSLLLQKNCAVPKYGTKSAFSLSECTVLFYGSHSAAIIRLMDRTSQHPHGLGNHLSRCCLILFPFLMFGCAAPNISYHPTSASYLTEVMRGAPGSVGVDLAIIEFDEFGMLWNRDQLSDAIDLIAQRNTEAERGIALVTYTHGWQNNADPEKDPGDPASMKASCRP
ncbi:MAG: hypothetical protein AAF357_07755, partial [Verrucomicrobiota bacterium]